MNKLNLLALFLFLAGVFAMFTLDTPVTRRIQDGVMAVLSPFIHASGAVEDGLAEMAAPAGDPRELKRENERLLLEVERLRIVSQKYAQLKEEANKLRGLIGFKQNNPFKMTAARVVKRVSSTWWNTMIIDKGSLDGLAVTRPYDPLRDTEKYGPHPRPGPSIRLLPGRFAILFPGEAHQPGVMAGASPCEVVKVVVKFRA